MKPIVADVHTHTIASGHAYGTIREMAAAAAEAGLEVLGITEHGPGIPGTCHPLYFKNLKAVPRTICGVSILHGSEVNILNDGTVSLEDRYLQYLDYAVAGIHVLCYEDAGTEGNTRNVISCMEHPKVRLISHPDDGNTPLDYTELVRAAVRTRTALEVNNSSFRKQDRRLNCVDNYRTMLALCERFGAPVILSSDAHDPSAVGRVPLASALLDEIGFPEELVLNTDRERLVRFLTEP